LTWTLSARSPLLVMPGCGKLTSNGSLFAILDEFGKIMWAFKR
jgi:hypothetical protein